MSNPGFYLTLVSTSFALVLLTTVLRAQEATLPPVAQQAMNKGLIATQQQDWTLAARYFDEARKAAPQRPEILFNLGLAESKISGRELRAIALLQAYLAASPQVTNAPAVRDEIGRLEIKFEGTVNKLISQTRQLAGQLPQSDRTSGLGQVGRLQALAGDSGGARQTASMISPKDGSDLEVIAKALAKAADIAGARDVASRIEGDVYKSSAYVGIVTIQAQRGDIAGAQTTAASVPVSNQYEGLIAVAEAQIKAGRAEEGQGTLVQARDAITHGGRFSKDWNYSSVALAQAAAGDFSAAQQTVALISDTGKARETAGKIQNEVVENKLKAGDFEGAFQLARTNPDADTRAEAYNKLVRRRLEAKQYDEAAKLIEDMPDSSWRKLDTYPKLINALAEAGRIDDARRVVAHVEGRLGALRTNSMSLGDFAEAAIRVGNLSLAKQLIPRTQYDFQRASLTQKLAAAYARSGDVATAKQEALALKDESARWSALDSIAGVQLKGGDIAGAVQTAAMIGDGNKRAWTHLAVSRQHLEAGDVPSALLTAALILDAAKRDDMYVSIATVQAEEGDIVGAMSTAGLVTGAVAKEKVADNISFQQSIRADFTGAHETAKGIVNPSLKVKSLSSIGYQQFSAGFLEGTKDTLRVAKDVASGIPSAPERAKAYSSLAWNFMSIGDMDAARAMLALADQAAEKIVELSPRNAAAPSDNLLRSAGLWAEARESVWREVEAADGMKEGWSKNSEYNSAAVRLVRLGDLAGALATARRLPEGETREETIARVIEEQVGYRGGKWAVDGLSTLKSAKARDVVWRGLVTYHIGRGELTAAEGVVAAMSEDARDNQLDTIGVAYAKAGNLVSAKAFAARLSNPRKVSGALFAAIVKGGDIAWGERVVSQLTEDNYARWTFLAEIAGAQAKAGRVADAKRTVALITIDGPSHSYYRAKGCQAVAQGDVAWALDCVARLRWNSNRASSYVEIARVQAGKGDADGTRQTLARARATSRKIEDSLAVAGAQADMGDVRAAAETLETVHPRDAAFDSWVQYQIITRAQDVQVARQHAGQIRDTYWKSRAIRALVDRIEQRADAKGLADGISDPVAQSQAYAALVGRDIKRGEFSEAWGMADAIPDRTFKLQAFADIVMAALARDQVLTVTPRLAGLSDGTVKTYLYIDIARGQLAAGADGPSGASLLNAEKAVVGMTSPFWTARAYGEISQLAAAANDEKLSERAKRMATSLASRVTDADRERLDRFTGAVTADRPSRSAPHRSVEDWERIVDDELNKLLYTDLSGYIQSLSAQGQSRDIFSGMTQAVTSLIEMSKRLTEMSKAD